MSTQGARWRLENEIEQREELSRATSDVIRRLLHDIKTPQPGNTLTHYTTQAGALGILRSKTLFATHARYLNDEKELRYVSEPLEDAWNRVRARQKNLTEEASDALDNFGRLLVIGASGKSLPAADNVYVTCFCENDDLLSQWRGYGGTDGPAYALTFQPQTFNDCVKPLAVGQEGPPVPLDGASTNLVKVIYDADNQVELISMALDDLMAPIIAMLHSENLYETDRIKSYVNALRGGLLVALGAPYKHPGFREENEWRLITRLDDIVMHTKTEFRPTQSGLAPYFRLGYWDEDPGTSTREPSSSMILWPLMGVMQGPTASPELGFESMKMLLNQEGHLGRLPEGLELSKVPYRHG